MKQFGKSATQQLRFIADDNLANRKALEPSHIAPTWVHYDVRCYEPRYLQDRMFCRTRKQLDGRRPIRF